MPNLTMLRAGPAQSSETLCCWNMLVAYGNDTFENTPVPPGEEGIHLLLLRRVFQNFKQAIVKPLGIRGDICAGEHRG